MQGDGNCVLIGMEGKVYWASGTDGYPGANLVVQSDGNIVIYHNGVARWNTGMKNSAVLVMQTDGNLVAYNSVGATWASNTNEPFASLSYVGTNLSRGQTLNADQYIRSSDQRYFGLMQSDRNLVVYGPGYKVLWNSGTAGYPGAQLVFQGDSNVVIYQNGIARWATGINDAVSFVIQNDGNLVAYTDSNSPAWASYSSQVYVPPISNIQITDVNKEGFSVRCNVSNNVKVKRVSYAAWTEKNGQDDLKRTDGALNTNETTCRIY